MSQTFKTNPICKGTPCVVHGNNTRTGMVIGRFASCYVVKLDKPYMFGRKHRTVIDTILAHPDNVFVTPAQKAASKRVRA